VGEDGLVSAAGREPAGKGQEAAVVRRLGRVAYEPTWRAMQDFTARRTADTPDELWLLEHPPVYTLGQAGRREHLLAATDIPLVPIDRGGQITYHGPGQAVAYVLVDLRRRGYGIRELVNRMEQAVIDLLAAHGVAARRLAGAPGVYVGGAKIAALGLRVKRGCTYHGLALNVDMDLAPFAAIDPCGYPGLRVTQCRDLGVEPSAAQIESLLVQGLLGQIFHDG
jgi:lipoyl(octanoyl) transferase